MIERLVGEVKTGRELTRAQADENDSLTKQLAAEKANGASLAVSYDLAKREIEALRTANDLLTKAVALHEQTVAVLKNDNDRLKAEAHKQRKRATVATLITIGTIAARFAGL